MLKGLEELNKIKNVEVLYDIEMTESGEEYMEENGIDLSVIEKELKALDTLIKWYQPYIIHDLCCFGASDEEIALVEEIINEH